MNRVAIVVSTSALLVWSLATLGAQEIQEGTWTGTRIRIGGRSMNPNMQRVSLEIKKAADPHVAWRPEKGQLLNITVVQQQQRLQASDFRLDRESLSFSYKLETTVVCQLARQPDGAYQGDCLADGDGLRFRWTLNPPKAGS